ncbi:Uma2 family endonuclease [Tundrisphaera lichenicola]|uniref:Uma2 family endonuclease n=1 Tax=Tundrisphaera lichenicola TaxID=2029860 RepID=UPI003EB85404
MAIDQTETRDRLHLGREDHGRLVTTDEYAEADFDEPWTYERVGGRLVVMSPEGTGHVLQSEPWRDRLGAYSLSHPGVVQAVVSQAWLRIDEQTTRIGDIGVYLGGEPESLDIPRQVPELMFEFVSPSKADRARDYVEKRADYQRAGVREYVIVDRFEKRVTVLTLVDGAYRERVLGMSETYTTPLLPGFSVRLAEVFPR